MSLQLTLANADFRAASEKWADHKLGCPSCSTAQRSRKLQNMCLRGARIYKDMKLCEEELAEERRLERLPIEGQLGLFSEDEVIRQVHRGQGA